MKKAIYYFIAMCCSVIVTYDLKGGGDVPTMAEAFFGLSSLMFLMIFIYYFIKDENLY